jgi:hypothetical protein
MMLFNGSRVENLDGGPYGPQSATEKPERVQTYHRNAQAPLPKTKRANSMPLREAEPKCLAYKRKLLDYEDGAL